MLSEFSEWIVYGHRMTSLRKTAPQVLIARRVCTQAERVAHLKRHCDDVIGPPLSTYRYGKKGASGFTSTNVS